MRSPLTETIYKVQVMIAHVRENLSTDEYMLFLDLLVPEPEPEVVKPAKKKRRASSKSPRATSIAQQIKGTGKPKTVCAFTYADYSACNQLEDNPIHEPDGGYAGYHLFTPPVPGVRDQSSASNGADGSILNSVGETVNAQGAAGGLSE